MSFKEDIEHALSQILVCSIEFEEKVAELYEKLASKIPHTLSNALLHIARESRNHAKTLRSLQRILGIKIKTSCRPNKYLAYINNTLENLEKQTLTLNKIGEILKDCINLEKFIGEEYYVEIVSRILKTQLKEIPLIENSREVEIWRTILEEIAEEENYHTKLISKVVESIH